MPRKSARRREPTPKQEGAQIIEAATKAGADYAHEQVGSPHFSDWVYDQIAEAEQMRKRDPSSVIPLETPADARKVARNMLQSLEWDTKRQMDQREILELAGAKGVFGAGSDDWVRDTYGITRKDVADAFFEAFDDQLQSQSTREWLTDEVLTRSEEVRGVPASKARRQPSARGAREAIHGYNIEVVYPDERFARKHESQIGHIIGQPLVSQGALRDGYRMEYGPIDRDDYRRLEGAIYQKLGNAVRVRLVQVAYGGSTNRGVSERREDQPYRVVFTTANGTIEGWVWATSERQAKRRLDDELGGAAFNLVSIEIDRSGRAPHPDEYEHSRGSKYFVRKLPGMARREGGGQVDPRTWAEPRRRMTSTRFPLRRR